MADTTETFEQVHQRRLNAVRDGTFDMSKKYSVVVEDINGPRNYSFATKEEQDAFIQRVCKSPGYCSSAQPMFWYAYEKKVTSMGEYKDGRSA